VTLSTTPARRGVRGHIIPPDLFARWLARHGLNAASLKRRYGFSKPTLANLAAGRPVSVGTIRRLDAIGRAEPVLAIADELLPVNGADPDLFGAGEKDGADASTSSAPQVKRDATTRPPR
jgi:hypothetical protein